MAGAPFEVAAGQPDLGNVVGGDEGLVIRSPTTMAEPFDLPHANEGAGSYAAKWRHMRAAVEADRTILARCRTEPPACPPAAVHVLAIIEGARTKEGRARLGEINRALNLAIRYQSDVIQHGASDAWASPLATLASGRGDCEDYAIAKYLALREAGMSPGDLRLVVVRDTRRHDHHAVLAARLEDRWLVLDNRRLHLLEDGDITDYTPISAFGPEPLPHPVAADAVSSQSSPS